MNILIANFSQIVTNRENIAIANKKVDKDIKLAYLYKTATNSNGQPQSHALVDCKFLANGER